jgi:hypothetical protein
MVREKPARSCRLKTASLQPRSHTPAIGVPVTPTWTFCAATATTRPSKFRCSATSRRIETTLDNQIRHGLLAELAELDGAGLAAAGRAEALSHIWTYSRRQRSRLRKLGASRVDHRSAAETIVSRLQ